MPLTCDSAFSKSSKAPSINERPMTSALSRTSGRTPSRGKLGPPVTHRAHELATTQWTRGRYRRVPLRLSSIALPAAPVRTDGGSNASTLSSKRRRSRPPPPSSHYHLSMNASMLVYITRPWSYHSTRRPRPGVRHAPRASIEATREFPQEKAAPRTRVSGKASSMKARSGRPSLWSGGEHGSTRRGRVDAEGQVNKRSTPLGLRLR